jgi:hypothetical protein
LNRKTVLNCIIMKKIITLSIVLALFVALTGSAQAIQVISSAPDAGTTSALMGIAVAGLAIVRRFIR